MTYKKLNPWFIVLSIYTSILAVFMISSYWGFLGYNQLQSLMLLVSIGGLPYIVVLSVFGCPSMYVECYTKAEIDQQDCEEFDYWAAVDKLDFLEEGYSSWMDDSW